MKTRTLCLIAACVATLSASPALAATESRLATCSHEGKGLKGEEREKFMSQCLKGHGDAKEKPVKEARHGEPAHGQQNRMKSCNEEAGHKALKGDERRAFMSTCLKG